MYRYNIEWPATTICCICSTGIYHLYSAICEVQKACFQLAAIAEYPLRRLGASYTKNDVAILSCDRGSLFVFNRRAFVFWAVCELQACVQWAVMAECYWFWPLGAFHKGTVSVIRFLDSLRPVLSWNFSFISCRSKVTSCFSFGWIKSPKLSLYLGLEYLF